MKKKEIILSDDYQVKAKTIKIIKNGNVMAYIELEKYDRKATIYSLNNIDIQVVEVI